MPAAVVAKGGTVNMQGNLVPEERVNPDEFRARTRRHIQQEDRFSYDSTSGDTGETVELRKSDILAGITVRFSGNLHVDPTGGTIASTARWPYDFINVKFQANGATNLINVSGLKMKARDVQKHSDLTDRGVVQTYGGSSKNQGTLAKATESWGVGSNTTALAGADYDVELEWFVPVAEDMIDLVGAIFLATATADLTLEIDFLPLSKLFTLTGTAVLPKLTGTFSVITHKFSIPVVDSGIIVPDLSMFHSLTQSRTTEIGTGVNEPRLVGQGAGRALVRLTQQLWNGAGNASAPVPLTAANFGLLAWRYATNETPDQIVDGNAMRYLQERLYNCDLGGVWGFMTHEFSAEDSWRDVVDLGTTSDLRTVVEVNSAVNLASPALEYVMETVYYAGQGS